MGITVLFSLSLSLVAQAQECCSALADDEFAVLHWDEDALYTAGTAFAIRVGAYDEGGRFQGAAGRREGVFFTRIGGGFRPGHRDMQFYGGIPLRLRYQADGDHSGWDVGLGDGFIGFRWTIWRGLKLGLRRGIRASFRPFLDVYIEGGFPTSRLDFSVWSGRAGIRASKYFTHRDVISAFGQMGGQQKLEADELRLRTGAGLSYRRIHSMVFCYGIGAEFMTVAGLEEVGFSISGWIDYVFIYPGWTLNGAIGTDWWGPVGGIDRASVGPIVELGVKRSF